MEARPVQIAGRMPWGGLVVAAWFVVAVGGILVSLWALLLQLRPPGDGESMTVLSACTEPESVIILEDNSLSVIELDPTDRRIAAVTEVVEILAAEPCTVDDTVAVISFTGRSVVTGPAPAAELGPVARADGDGTDIAAAADAAIDVASALPDHRPVVVLVSDLDEGSGTPIGVTLDRLAASGIDVILVSIGEVPTRAGVTEIELRSSGSIAEELIAVIDTARRTT